MSSVSRNIKTKTKIVKISLITIAFLGVPLISQAETFEVPTLEYPTIDDGIDAARAGDVVLVHPGTYYENLIIEHNSELRSVAGAEATIIDGGDAASVVAFIHIQSEDGYAAKISGFTIQNGYSVEGQGGGVTLYDSDAIVENNRIISNIGSVDGGAILIDNDSDGVIRNNFIDSNSCTRYGSGIFVVRDSDPLIYNNWISNNSASGAEYAGGGAIAIDDNSHPQILENTMISNYVAHVGGGISIRAECAPIIEDNTINDNIAAFGGGIHIETGGSGPEIRNNTIHSNEARTSALYAGSGFGGGISVYDQSTPLITENTITENFATEGGGGIVVSESANPNIIGNRIGKNTITTSSGNYTGGGIYVANALATIYNNVIYRNEARLGGGIGLESGAQAVIYNNTIVNNLAPFTQARPSGGGISVRNVVTSARIMNNIITQNQDYQIFEEELKAEINYNLINNDDRGIYFNWYSWDVNEINSLNNNAYINATGNISGDEVFYNTVADDYRIYYNSSALNQARQALFYIYDIDYNLRSYGGTADMGAYEYTEIINRTEPVFRFWSDDNSKHFYTINSAERNEVLNTYHTKGWKYEGVRFRSFPLHACNGTSVFRFWSSLNSGHFYTNNEAERDQVMANYTDDQWYYEGPNYCAEAVDNSVNIPLYRFWSAQNSSHFYTAEEGEKLYVEYNYSDAEWLYESIAFYVYPK